jgi:hypothetical protein
VNDFFTRRRALAAGAGAAALALGPAPWRRALAQVGAARGDSGRGDSSDYPREDHRAWQHGIELLRVEGRLLLIWGSAGNPPRPNLGGDWPHDIYYAWLADGDEARTGEVRINPQVLVSRPEAQEPPSAAINSRGRILVTAEDGEDDINQRAGLWDSRLRPLKPWPYTIRKGGHSGHAAALGERFLVVYGEGWEEGGGFMDRGTGRDIHARILDAEGTPGAEIHISRGQRDGWPLVAAGERNWMVVWQRYAGLGLYAAVIDTAGKTGAPQRIAEGMSLRYAYDVAWAAALKRYVVMGNREGRGFLALLDAQGKPVALQEGLPAIASEGRLVLRAAGEGEAIAAYPMMPSGVALLRVDTRGARQDRRIEHVHDWDYMGTTGLFMDGGRLLQATLSTRGVRAFVIETGL